jgi:hypothetical protein
MVILQLENCPTAAKSKVRLLRKSMAILYDSFSPQLKKVRQLLDSGRQTNRLQRRKPFMALNSMVQRLCYIMG